MTKKYIIKDNIQSLENMLHYNVMDYKNSSRRLYYKRLLQNIEISNFSSFPFLGNAQFFNMIVSLAKAQAVLSNIKSDYSGYVAHNYRNDFYSSIDETLCKMIMESNALLTQKEAYAKLEKSSVSNEKIKLDAKTVLKVLQKSFDKVNKQSAIIAKKDKAPWVLQKVLSFTTKPQKMVYAKLQKLKTKKNKFYFATFSTPKVFSKISDFINKTQKNISEIVGLLKSKKKKERKIRRHKVATMIKHSLITAGVFAMGAWFGVAKQQTKQDKNKKSDKTETVYNWQKVSAAEHFANSFNYQDVAKEPLLKTQYKAEVVKDSKRILAMWVKKENLNKVITSLISQGLTEDQAYRYAHMSALCGSKTTDNMFLKDVNGKGVAGFSNGNHTMWGAQALKDAGVSKAQRDVIANSVDFKTGRTNISQSSVNAFKILDQHLGANGRLTLKKLSNSFLKNGGRT